MDAEFIGTSRGGNNLIVANNIYRLIRKKNDKTYWRCAYIDGTCKCTAVTKNDEVLSSSGVHAHGKK